MKRLAIFLPAIVSAVLFFTSCEGNIPVKDKSLYGKWEEYATTNMYYQFEPYDTIDTYITFEKNNVFRIESPRINGTGKYWTYNNATLRVTGEDSPNILNDFGKEKRDFIKMQMPSGDIIWHCYSVKENGEFNFFGLPGEVGGHHLYYRRVK